MNESADQKRLHVGNLARYASFIASGSLSTAFLGLAESIILARSLGPTQFGVWGTIGALCTWISGIVGLRTTEPLLKFWSHYKAENLTRSLLPYLITAALSIDALTGIVSFLIIGTTQYYFHILPVNGEDEFVATLLIASLILIACSDSTWNAIIRDQRDFKFHAATQIGFAFLRITSLLAAWWWFDLTIVSAAFLTVAIASLKSIFTATYIARVLIRNYDISPRQMLSSFDLTTWRKLHGFWEFVRMSYWSTLISSSIKNIDLILLSAIVLPAQVGEYKLAKSLAATLQFGATAGATAIYPDFNESLVFGAKGLIPRMLRRITVATLPMAAVGVAMAWFIGPFAIDFLYGQEFASASGYFRLMLPGVGVVSAFFWAQPLVLALGEYRANLRNSILNAFIYLAAMVILLPTCGASGAAIALGLTWSLSCVLSLRVVLRTFK